jgi:drug/metabolite transporter (DMT)-like permease
LGIFYLHEPVTVYEVLGILLIFAGLAVLSMERPSPLPETA